MNSHLPSMAVESPFQPTVLPGTARNIPEPPTFDLHKIEEALKTNHRLYNGTPMTSAEIKGAVREYRQFLADHKAAGAPDTFEVPSRMVDRVWHTHMCETEQYAQDCQAYFGKFI